MKRTRLFTEDGVFIGVVDRSNFINHIDLSGYSGSRHTLYDASNQPVGYLLDEEFIPLGNPVGGIGLIVVLGIGLAILAPIIMLFLVLAAPIIAPIFFLASYWGKGGAGRTRSRALLALFFALGLVVDGIIGIFLFKEAIDIEPICSEISITVEDDIVTVENNSDYTLISVMMYHQQVLHVVVASNLPPDTESTFKSRSRIYGWPYIYARDHDGKVIKGPCFSS